MHNSTNHFNVINRYSNQAELRHPLLLEICVSGYCYELVDTQRIMEVMYGREFATRFQENYAISEKSIVL